MRKIILIFLVFLFFSCSKKSTAVNTNKKFFDIEKYMNEYLEKYLIQEKIEQITKYNGKEETILKDSSELTALWRLINNSNINKSTFYDKYVVDYSRNLERYIALDSSLLVRELSVFKEDSKIEKIIIQQKFKNINSQSIRDFNISQNGNITMQKIVNQQDSLFITWKLCN